MEFLSTPSARRATCKAVQTTGINGISIHALREEGDNIASFICEITCISIHALREEGDTAKEARRANANYISIHALREEGDP